MDMELLERLERIVRAYEHGKEMEMRKAEIGAKIAADIMAQNRKSTMDLMTHFYQFVVPSTYVPPKKDG